MARPKTFDREQALESAMNLFWAKGYEATSVQDLLDAMGINRGSMYTTFGGKRALFLAALERYCARLRGDTATGDSAGATNAGPLAEIRETFRSRIGAGPDPRWGCFLCNTIVELAPHDEEVADRAESALRRLEAGYLKLLIRAAGQLPENARPPALASFLTNAYLGLQVRVKTEPDSEAMGGMIETALSILDHRPVS